MRLEDELDYRVEDRQDLIARLMQAQALNVFLLKAYAAAANWGVNFKGLKEWQDQSELDDVHKLKPHQAQQKIINYMSRLDSALDAAIRRAQFKLHNFPKTKQ